MRGERARRACEPSGQGEEASAQGLGGDHLLPQTDVAGPAGEVVSQHLYGHPVGVGCKSSRWQMVQSHAVLEVTDAVRALDVSAMVCLQLEGVALSVRSEG